MQQWHLHTSGSVQLGPELVHQRLRLRLRLACRLQGQVKEVSAFPQAGVFVGLLRKLQQHLAGLCVPALPDVVLPEDLSCGPALAGALYQEGLDVRDGGAHECLEDLVHLLVAEEVIEDDAVHGRDGLLRLCAVAELQRGRLPEEVFHQRPRGGSLAGLHPISRLPSKRLQQSSQQRAGTPETGGRIGLLQLLELVNANLNGAARVLNGHGLNAVGQRGPLVLLRGRGHALRVAPEHLGAGASTVGSQARLHVPQVHLREDGGA
mmetsp:Transcript_86729/g.268506  ORF Transcript_86729/g.268506 Transcript_86729/m.268506 type:complete len:264 (+) Transcript_86729:1208-1999(+)